jgi:hypothetical protein
MSDVAVQGIKASKGSTKGEEGRPFVWSRCDVNVKEGGSPPSGLPLATTGWVPSIPASIWKATSKTNPEIKGYGNYTITVTVTESDDFGKLVAKAAEATRQNKQKIVERVVEVIPSQDTKNAK